jgi:hypothetical protein
MTRSAPAVAMMPGAKYNSRKPMPMPVVEANSTGRRPTRSAMPPTKGVAKSSPPA